MDARTRYIGKKELRDITDLSYTTWWRLERAHDAPARIRMSDKRVVWDLSEVLSWCKSRQKERGSHG